MKTKLIILAVMLFGTVLARLIAASSVSLAWDHSPDFTNYPGAIVYRVYHQTNIPPTTNFNAVGVTTFDAGTNALFHAYRPQPWLSRTSGRSPRLERPTGFTAAWKAISRTGFSSVHS